MEGNSDGRFIDADETTNSAFSPEELRGLRAACTSDAVQKRLQTRLKPVYEVAVLRFLVEPRGQIEIKLVIQGLSVLEWDEVPEESWLANIPSRVLNRNWSANELFALCCYHGYTGIPGDVWRLFLTMVQMKRFSERLSE